MTQRVFVGVLTVFIFLAGYVTRALTDRGEPVPPPPAALTRELVPGPTPDKGRGKNEVDRAKIVAEINKLRPQIEAYTTQVQEIYTEFDREFALLLTPAQREKFALNHKRRSDYHTKRLNNRALLSDEELMRERDRPLTDIYRMVTVTPSLEWMTKEYTLDAAQQNAVRQMLSLRRNKFVALFDATPHPSIRLSRLAGMLERVTGAPAPAATLR